MKKAIRLMLIIVVEVYGVSFSQTRIDFIDTKDAYFGLTPPGIVSDSTWAEHSQVAVSPDGKYLFYMRHIGTQHFF